MIPFIDIHVEIVALITILIIGLLLRVMQFIRFRYPGGPDVFFHLLYIRDPEKFFENIQPYPYLFDVFSREVKKIAGISDHKLGWIGVFPDIITGLITYFFIRVHFGNIASLIALALFLTTPGLIFQSTFGPRSMGLLFYTVSLLALTMPFPIKALSVLFVSLAALTHKLSIQTLFFVVLAYSIFDATIVVYFAAGILLAFLISKMKYHRILRFHLSYVKLMIRNPKLRYSNKEYLAFVSVPHAAVVPLSVVLLLDQSVSESVLKALNSSMTDFWTQPVGRFFLIWSLVPLLLVFLWRFGDSHRYVIYGSFPLALLYSIASLSNYPLFLFLVVIFVANIVLSLYITRENTVASKSFLQAVDFLSKIVDDGFCCPQKHFWAVKYFTNGRGVYLDSKEPSRAVKPDWEEIRGFEYVIAPNQIIDNLKVKYTINVIFSNDDWTVGKVETNN